MINVEMINSVSIIGSGQVGTSIALALTKAQMPVEIRMMDADAAAPDLVNARFSELGLSPDSITFYDTVKDATIESDLVVIATPLSAMGDVSCEIGRHAGIGTIVTDTGSAKEKAIATISEALAGTGVPYVPAHPGNGSQGSGPASASPGNILGANSWMFVIEDKTSPASPAHRIVKDFWTSAGVNVTATDTDTHDRFFGTCSHLEHLLVFTYLNISRHESGMENSFAAGGTAFRNLTRIAISKNEPDKPSPLVQMWRPIFEQNREKILEAASNFQDHIYRLLEAVQGGDHNRLRNLWSDARDFRASIADPEPRENLQGEIADVKAAFSLSADDSFTMDARVQLTNALMVPLAIAYAQTLNARDVDAELVRGKANPSFRDGTALALNDPDEVAAFLLANAEDFSYMVEIFRGELCTAAETLRNGDWPQVEADILHAQSIRSPLPGPRKGADVRPEYTLPRIA